MDEQIVQQIVDEILSPLEPLDTRSAALLEFLKAKGMASDEELAPYLEQAGNASNVRWLAARVRIMSLISSAMKTVESKSEQPAESANSIAESPEPAEETKQETSQENKAETRPATEKSDENPPPDEPVRANTEKDENKKESKPVKSNEVAKESAA